MWGVKERVNVRTTPRVLASASGWKVLPITGMVPALRRACSHEKINDSIFDMFFFQTDLLLDIQVEMDYQFGVGHCQI